jgi:MFS family permease
MDFYTGAIISLIGTIVGAILGGTITYFWSWRLAKKVTKSAIGGKLRAVFASILAEYNFRAEKGDFYLIQDNFIKNAITSPGAVIEEYRWFVPSTSQGAYQQAWEDYQSGDVGNAYIFPGGKKLFKQRIEAILEFTKD